MLKPRAVKMPVYLKYDKLGNHLTHSMKYLTYV